MGVRFADASSVGPSSSTPNAGRIVGAPLHSARTSRTLRATFRLDSPMKNPHTDPFQTPLKLGHTSYPNAPKSKSPKLP